MCFLSLEDCWALRVFWCLSGEHCLQHREVLVAQDPLSHPPRKGQLQLPALMAALVLQEQSRSTEPRWSQSKSCCLVLGCLFCLGAVEGLESARSSGQNWESSPTGKEQCWGRGPGHKCQSCSRGGWDSPGEGRASASCRGGWS